MSPLVSLWSIGILLHHPVEHLCESEVRIRGKLSNDIATLDVVEIWPIHVVVVTILVALYGGAVVICVVAQLMRLVPVW